MDVIKFVSSSELTEKQVENLLKAEELQLEKLKLGVNAAESVGRVAVGIAVTNWFLRAEKAGEYLTPGVRSALLTVLRIVGIKL